MARTNLSSLFLPQTVEELVQCLDLIPHPEGGFFRETFRSGSVPMTTRGGTDTDASPRNLVLRGDETSVRNCLTSIFWVPTKDSPRLLLSTHRSDHVHYYQGGAPFEYLVYRPNSGTLTRTILGPDIRNGQVLQLAVEGGCYKCGRLLDDVVDNTQLPYSIIAEAVGPGFDVQDFEWVTTSQLEATGRHDVMTAMKDYVHPEQEKVQAVEIKAEHFDKYYDNGTTENE